MLLKAIFPLKVRSSLFLEGYVAKHFGLKKVRLKKYVEADAAVSLLGLSYAQLLKELIRSKTLHGVEVDGKILIHPDTILKRIVKRYRIMIARNLRNGPYEGLNRKRLN